MRERVTKYTNKKSLQSGSHMCLNVPDELRLVPSLLDEVVGVVSRHATFFERSLVQCSRAQYSAVCSCFTRVPHLWPG